MDTLLHNLGTASDSVISWIHGMLPPDQQHQAPAMQERYNNPDPATMQSVSQDFQDFQDSTSAKLAQLQPQANQFMHGIQDVGGNIIHSGINALQGLWNSGAIGVGQQQNPAQNFLAQTPQYIQQAEQGIQNAMPNNFLGSVGKDVTGIVGGTLSLPGIAANAVNNPQTIPQTAGTMLQGIISNYAHDFGYNSQDNSWSLQNAGNNLYNRPVSTILDLLPFVGGVAKLGALGKAGEVGDAAEIGDTASTAQLAPQARLENLMHSGTDLLNSGYTKDMVKNLSAEQSYNLLKNDVAPWDYLSNPEVANNPALATDIATQQRAFGQVEGNAPQGLPKYIDGLKGLPQNIVDSFKTWVNSRAASNIEGMAKQQEFQKYDSEGLQGLLNFEKDPSQYQDLKNYFDAKHAELSKAGVDMGYLGNYIPHLFQDEDAAQQFANRTLSRLAPFTFERTIKSYNDAIAAGLTPRYNSLSQLAQWYEGRANRLLADTNYFNTLRQNGLIQPSSKAPGDWGELGQGFPKRVVTLGDGSSFQGNFSAPPTLANAINGYLKGEPDGPLQGLANVQSRIKNTVLSSGIPKTGISWHGISTLTRQTLASNNPISGFLTGVKFLASPSTAQDFIDQNLGQAATAVKSGLNLSLEDHDFFSNNNATGVLGKISDVQKSLFEDPLFKQAIPALKISKWQEIRNDLVKNGYDEDSASQLAAKQSNDLFGGINLQEIARNPQFTQLMRNVAFAPDFMESTYNMGKGVAQGFLDPANPAGKTYRTFARNLALSYVALNLTNKLASGHFAFQNASGHKMDLEMGATPDGQTRYITPYASGADMVKLPLDFASSLLGGNTGKTFSTIRNRLAPLEGMAMDQLTNTNYLSQPLYPRGASAAQQWLGRGTDVLSSTLPPQISAGARYLTGNQGLEQAITSGMQAPVRYGGGASTKAQQTLVQNMQQAGAPGTDIAQALDSQRQQTAQKYSPTSTQQPGIVEQIMTSLGMGQPKTQTAKQTGDLLLDTLNKQKTISQQTKNIKDIFESGMTPQQISQTLAAKGIDEQTARETMIKSLPVADRAPIVAKMIQAVGNDPKWLDAVHELGAKDILTTGITEELVKDGTLTPEQRTAIDKEISSAKGTATKTATTGSYLGGYNYRNSSGRYSISLPSHTLQMLQTPKFQAAQLKPVSATPTMKTPDMTAFNKHAMTFKPSTNINQSPNQNLQGRNTNPNAMMKSLPVSKLSTNEDQNANAPWRTETRL